MSFWKSWLSSLWRVFVLSSKRNRKRWRVVRFSHDAARQRSFLRMLCLYFLLSQLWPLTSRTHTHIEPFCLDIWTPLVSKNMDPSASLTYSLAHRVSIASSKFSWAAECLHGAGRLHWPPRLSSASLFSIDGALTWIYLLSPVFPLSTCNL